MQNPDILQHILLFCSVHDFRELRCVSLDFKNAVEKPGNRPLRKLQHAWYRSLLIDEEDTDPGSWNASKTVFRNFKSKLRPTLSKQPPHPLPNIHLPYLLAITGTAHTLKYLLARCLNGANSMIRGCEKVSSPSQYMHDRLYVHINSL